MSQPKQSKLSEELEKQAEELEKKAEELQKKARELRKRAKEEKVKEKEEDERKRQKEEEKKKRILEENKRKKEEEEKKRILEEKKRKKEEEEEELRKAQEELKKKQKMETDRKKAEEAIRKKSEEEAMKKAEEKKTPSKTELDECEEKLRKIQQIITGEVSRSSSRAPSRAPSHPPSRAPSPAPSRPPSRAPSPKEEKKTADLLTELLNVGKTETSREKAEEALKKADETKQVKQISEEEKLRRQAIIQKKIEERIAKESTKPYSAPVSARVLQFEKEMKAEKAEIEKRNKEIFKKADIFNNKYYPQGKEARQKREQKYKKMNVSDKVPDIYEFIRLYGELHERRSAPLYAVKDLFYVFDDELEETRAFDIDKRNEKIWIKGEKEEKPKKQEYGGDWSPKPKKKDEDDDDDFNMSAYLREMAKIENPTAEDAKRIKLNAKKKNQIETEQEEFTPKRGKEKAEKKNY